MSRGFAQDSHTKVDENESSQLLARYTRNWNWEADNPFGAQKRKLTPESSDAIKYSISGMTLRISIAYRAFSQKVLARHAGRGAPQSRPFKFSFFLKPDIIKKIGQETRKIEFRRLLGQETEISVSGGRA